MFSYGPTGSPCDLHSLTAPDEHGCVGAGDPPDDLKHAQQARVAADDLAKRLRKLFGNRILGPEYPLVSRIMNYYLKQIMVKIERSASQTEMKKILMQEMEEFSRLKEFSPLRLVIDVDPQ